MCAELQEVFGMSINAAPLPFPLKDGAVASPQPAVVLGSASASASAGSKALGGHNPDESIELTRAPRDSEVCRLCTTWAWLHLFALSNIPFHLFYLAECGWPHVVAPRL